MTVSDTARDQKYENLINLVKLSMNFGVFHYSSKVLMFNVLLFRINVLGFNFKYLLYYLITCRFTHYLEFISSEQ